MQTEGQNRQPGRQPGGAAALVCGNEVTGFQIANKGSQRDAAVWCLCRSHCVSTASRQIEKKAVSVSLWAGRRDRTEER